jgi:hypothetical protein
LLFEEDDQKWQGVLWRNAAAFLRVPASFWVVLTLVFLLVGIIDSFIPAAWLIVTLALLITVFVVAMRIIVGSYRARSRSEG